MLILFENISDPNTQVKNICIKKNINIIKIYFNINNNLHVHNNLNYEIYKLLL